MCICIWKMRHRLPTPADNISPFSSFRSRYLGSIDDASQQLEEVSMGFAIFGQAKVAKVECKQKAERKCKAGNSWYHVQEIRYFIQSNSGIRSDSKA
jgi:predicted NUDIX family phosphoesterase